MKKVFYLATCDTCKRILKELHAAEKGFEMREIKSQPVSVSELEELRKLSGSYSSLFSKMARKYKELGLAQKELSEEEIKQYILSDYTFLKRPVFVIGNQVFAGNSAAVIEQVKDLLFR